ncbi:putative transcription factor & chromatin remodeling CW-Zn family [Lupinus albus]|uniref:Putative transcription factor & chromatin remodeling CW-Zn family n=1 Tax=Lupinus albus TaxID=3870 RepID=A0A6A4P3Q7_LUPAL|nr:putative transcription factor & chromatin remodeling CW-Zn family [Lupinus albus]
MITVLFAQFPFWVLESFVFAFVGRDAGLQGRFHCEKVTIWVLGFGLGLEIFGGVIMENNIELEEGEAFFNDDVDEYNIDLESLSYIDEKIQHVLGHFQKDFQGDVSAKNLGAKFGDYGSFLPTYERSRVESHPKTPQRNHCTPKSPINLHKEVVSHSLKAPSNVPPSRLGIASYNSHLIHNVRAPSVDDSGKKEGVISSSEVSEKSTVKDDTRKKSRNSTDQRTLKFRIKVKSSIFAQKNAAIYSGLGLDNSPSSSMGNSPMQSEGMLPVSKENVNNSPTEIIKIMTSFPIPGGILTSPVPDSMFHSIRKEKVIGHDRFLSSVNGHQESSLMSTDESDSFVGDAHLKNRKVKIVRQSGKKLEFKHMNGFHSENDMALHAKKKLGNRTPDRKDVLSNDLKCTLLKSSICDAGETTEVTGKASEFSREVTKDGVPGRMVSVGVVKEESYVSISGQGFEKVEKQKAGNGFMKKVLDHTLENSRKDKFSVHKNNDKCNNTSVISDKVECDAIKYNIDQNPQKRVTNQKKKAVSEGKSKSKVYQSPEKAEVIARKDIFGGTNNPKVTAKESAGFDVTSGRSKMNKTKSLKETKVRDRDSLNGTKSELKVDGPPGTSAIKNANIGNFEKQSTFSTKVKGRPNVNKVDVQFLAGTCTKDASGSFPFEDKPAPEMIPLAVAAPQLIAEDWVCCDSCHKWRLLPTCIKPEELPENWLCSMQNWLPGKNRCDISEEETTNALHAFYQIPISECQNNMQSHGTGTKSGVSSADAVQFGQNKKKSRFDALSVRGKKKRDINEKTMTGVKNYMTNDQESGKNISSTDLNQHPADSNPMEKMSSKCFSMCNSLIEEKHVAKEIQKQINGGNRKVIKLKRKMDTDQYRSGTPKKSKPDDVCHTEKQLKPVMCLEDVGLKSRNGLPAKASGMDMRKYDDYCLSDDIQDKLLDPVKKEGNRTRSDSGSFGVKNGGKSDGSVKKRKLKDWVDNEEHNNSFSLQGNKQCDKEGNESGFRKEKKSRILDTEVKSVTEVDKLNNGGITQVCLSGSNDQMAVGMKVKFVDKAQQPKKHTKDTASRQASFHIVPFGKSLGSGQLSLAATSSSSKVSGSHRAKTNLEYMIGSPVESVTSSPLWTSKMNKHIFAVGDISGKDDSSKGGLSSIGSKKIADNREGKLSVKLKKDGMSHNFSPAYHKVSSSIEYQVEDVKDKARFQAKTSEVKNDCLLEGGALVEQRGSCANGMHHEVKVHKNSQESELTWQNSCKVTSLHRKEKDRKSGSLVGIDKMKLSALENGYSKNGGRHDSAIDPSYHASVPATRNDAKCSSPKSKLEIDNINQKNALRHGSSESGKKIKVKQKDLENSLLKMDAHCSAARNNISQQNLIQDFEEENEATHVYSESRDGQSKVLTSSVDEIKSGTLYVGSRTAPGFQKGGSTNEHPVHVSGNGDVAYTMRKSVDLSSKAGVNYNSEKVHDQHLTMSSPVQTNSSQTACNMLEEATKLKDRATHFKNSGFEFESNETYFDAALKFLHGASLVEICHNESNKHKEMNQMQLYATAAKLFKSCAHEYERCQEMAVATLAYKCMEVAYMRVVYCKHSSANRDWHELQSSLQMVSQGESPSSSASDVDNFNNQTAVDKATFPRSTNTHVSGNQVLSAETRPNLVRLLDFVSLSLLVYLVLF